MTEPWTRPDTPEELRLEIRRLEQEERSYSEGYWGFNRSNARTKRQECEAELKLRTSTTLNPKKQP